MLYSHGTVEFVLKIQSTSVIYYELVDFLGTLGHIYSVQGPRFRRRILRSTQDKDEDTKIHKN